MTQETQAAGTTAATSPLPESARNEFYDLRPRTFRFAWLALLLVHGLCAYFYCVSGILYKRTPGSMVEVMLVSYRVGMPMDAYPALSGVHFFFGVLHAIMGSLMLLWSIYRQRCSFGPLQDIAIRTSAPSSKVASSRFGITASPTSQDHQASNRSCSQFVTTLCVKLFSRNGLFGVEGPYFEQILTIREAVETILQVIQAYRMGQYLPRPWLNRFYLGILVVNCWLGPLLHVICRHNKMQRRTFALVCDLILDMMSAIGVSALVMVSLYKDYDVELGGFATSLWYDAKWFVQTTTELQILLVSSWGDLASRVIFSVGVLVGLDSIKDMLREVPSVDVQTTAKERVTSDNSGLSITQSPSKVSAPTSVLPKRRSPYRLHLVSSFRKVNSLWERRVLQLVHGCLLATGVVVLGLHLHAESIPTPHQCVIQVHPWAKRAPACLFVRLDCHHSQHSGELARVAAEWGVLDPSFARQLLVTHCSAFEVPPALQRFSNIVGLKMYNTSITRWDANAAITRLNHPNLVTMTLGRVNMTAGTLPPGLVSPDFPPQLVDVSFAYSNLHTVPDELAASWPSSAGFGCEVCGFTSIPQAVLGMRDLRWLAFANNPLASFPVEAVTSPRLEILSLGGIAFPSFQLPDPSALASTALTQLYLQHSNLTYLPKWVDAYVSKRRDLWYAAPLDLTGTPFCAALAELRAGSRTGFPADWLHGVAAEEVSDWMTLGRENVSAIDGRIECASEWTMFYPTAEEDARYSLRQT